MLIFNAVKGNHEREPDRTRKKGYKMSLGRYGLNLNQVRCISSRLLPETVRGQMLRGQIKLNPIVADVINDNILSNHLPNNIRRHMQHMYIKLRENEMFPQVKTTLETDSFIGAFFLRDYGATYQVLNELKRRLDESGIIPQSVLEVSHSPGVGMIAMNDLLSVDKSGKNLWGKKRKDSVVLGGNEMVQRAKLLLTKQEEDNIKTRIISSVPGTTQKYDLIILNHQLLRDPKRYPYEIDSQISHYLPMLNEQGIIVILERGTPTGAETIGRARELIIRDNEVCQDWNIIAPCSHMGRDPLQLNNLNYYKMKGNKLKFISFQKMIQRPRYSLELKRGKLLSLPWDNTNRKKLLQLRGKGRPEGTDHELINYTYLIAGKNVSPNEIDHWPRIISPPIKKKGHVILNVCTVEPEVKIENWIIPKSFSKEVYHDARKAQWGDLWPHDAKSKIPIRQKTDLMALKAMERERVKQLRREEKGKDKLMRRQLSSLDGVEVTPENITQMSKIYNHFNK